MSKGKEDKVQTGNSQDFSKISEQLRSLENVLISWQEERKKEQEKNEKRYRRFLVQLVIIVTSAVGVVWSGVEMGAWYVEKLQLRKMSERYMTVALEMYEKENNPEVALQFLENSIELDDSFSARYQTAYIKGMKAVQFLLNLDRPFTQEELNVAHQALADAKFLKEIESDRPEGYILESQIYTALKEYDAAERSIMHALKISPENAFAKVRYATLLYNRKQYQNARTVIEEVVNSNPEDKWARLWYGLILDKLKDQKAAVAQFEMAIKLDPKFDAAIYNLGCCYLNSRPRQFQKARECFQRVLVINPSYKQAYYQLGMSYGYQDNYSVALTYMDKAIALSPDYLTAQNWRALVLFEMKRYQEAADAYSSAIKLDPRNDELYVSRANARKELKLFDAAMDDLHFALELNPENLDAWLIMSNIYLQNNQVDLAFKMIQTAMKSANGKKAFLADLWSLSARLWQKKGDLNAAIRDQKESVKCYETKASLYRLAFYQNSAGLFDDALATIDKLHKLDARYANAWKLKVMILKNRDKKLALEALEQYLALRPNDQKMQKLKQELLKQ
ncbi:MAG: tetratricopeptide repeat protein [Lentisphaeria bacterium]|nr:tetratricopeptide repeat protein [Lentisphaeria bacterium]